MFVEDDWMSKQHAIRNQYINIQPKWCFIKIMEFHIYKYFSKKHYERKIFLGQTPKIKFRCNNFITDWTHQSPQLSCALCSCACKTQIFPNGSMTKISTSLSVTISSNTTGSKLITQNFSWIWKENEWMFEVLRSFPTALVVRRQGSPGKMRNISERWRRCRRDSDAVLFVSGQASCHFVILLKK